MTEDAKTEAIREQALECLFSGIENEIEGVRAGHAELDMPFEAAPAAIADEMARIAAGWRDDATYQPEAPADPNNPDGRYDEDLKRWAWKGSPLESLNGAYARWGFEATKAPAKSGMEFVVHIGSVPIMARDDDELRRIVKAFRFGIGREKVVRIEAEVQDRPAARAAPKDEIGIARGQPSQSGVEALRKMLEHYPLTGTRQEQRVRRALDAVLQCQFKVMNPPETDSTRNIYVMFWRMHLQVALDAALHVLGARCPCWLAQVACFEGDQADLLEQSLEAVMKIDMDFWVDLPRHRESYQARQKRINEWWARQVEGVADLPTPPPPGSGLKGWFKVVDERLDAFADRIAGLEARMAQTEAESDAKDTRLDAISTLVDGLSTRLDRYDGTEAGNGNYSTQIDALQRAVDELRRELATVSIHGPHQ